MPSCILDTCCGCVELRTGSLVIGYLNLVGNIIVFAMTIVGLAAGASLSANGKDQDAKDTGVVISAVAGIFALVVLFFLIFTIVLLVGIHKNKRGHVKAYLIVATICLVLSIITLLASFAGKISVGDIISKLLSIALSFYFILVIRSYYYKMDDNKRPPIYSAA